MIGRDNCPLSAFLTNNVPSSAKQIKSGSPLMSPKSTDGVAVASPPPQWYPPPDLHIQQDREDDFQYSSDHLESFQKIFNRYPLIRAQVPEPDLPATSWEAIGASND